MRRRRSRTRGQRAGLLLQTFVICDKKSTKVIVNIFVYFRFSSHFKMK